MEKLIASGADIRCVDSQETAGDSVATVIAQPSSLRDIVVEQHEVPSMIDEIPLLACVAAAAGVKLQVSGAGELRVKESDRIALVVSNLRAIGVECEESNEGFVVHGKRDRLKGGVVTDGDHRIAMAFGILGELRGNQVEVDDPVCVRVSYPSFWDDLRDLRD
jgi:3-phosphoshikimate 1-carboxyvinyltransferase